mmetsp:Transcript_32797/g.62973  ORF Transcript_32797/g.62973 Transcript_32797/m.62973 type:complete len:211 (-) Transcript_32797:1199-1831(-)
MGQQQHQPRGLAPLLLRTGDELVNHHLGVVGKVPELGLPHDCGGRVEQAVAVLEAQHPRLRERAIPHLELVLVAWQHVLQRDVRLVGHLVVEDSVPLVEGAPRAVLTAQPDVHVWHGGRAGHYSVLSLVVAQQSAERQLLRRRPVHARLRVREHLAARLQQFLDVRVGGEVLGQRAQSPPHVLQGLEHQPCVLNGALGRLLRAQSLTRDV